jgi:DNA-binding transcriptional LysR family regulator
MPKTEIDGREREAMRVSATLLDRLSLTTLRLMQGIDEEGSLTKAAGRLNIAVSAASRRLVDLEAALGVPVFERGARGMQPTPAGAVLLIHARRMLLAVEDLSSEISELRAGVRGHVRMLANLSAIVAYLPDLLDRFFQEHPQLRIDLEERPTSRVVRGIAEGWAEIGICSSDTELAGVRSQVFRRDRLGVLLRPDHPIAGQSQVAYRDTLPFDQISLHVDSSIFTRSQIAARDAGMVLRSRIHVPGFDAICQTVQAGLGIAVVPEPVHRMLGAPVGLAFVGLTDGWAERELFLIASDTRPLSASARLLERYLLRAPASLAQARGAASDDADTRQP